MYLLSIGNSFSQDAQAWLHQMAASAAVEIEAVNLYIGGCCLQLHSDNVREDGAAYELEINGQSTGRLISVAEALAMKPWDVITFQQCSSLSGIAESYEPYLGQLVESVRTTCPRAELYFHETWAYEITSDHEGFAAYGNSQEKMYACIAKQAQAASTRHGLALIPVGELIQTLRAMPVFDVRNGGHSLCRDGYHLDHLYGRYAAAAQWLETLSGTSASTVDFVPVHDAQPADRCLLAAIREAVIPSTEARRSALRNENI